MMTDKNPEMMQSKMLDKMIGRKMLMDKIHTNNAMKKTMKEKMMQMRNENPDMMEEMMQKMKNQG